MSEKVKTPKSEQKIEDSNQYIIIFNKKKHIIKFELDDKRILFTVVRQEKNSNDIYFLHQSKLESLRQNSKILQLFPSVPELIELFDELFKNKKIFLEYNNYSNELEEEENTKDNNTNKSKSKELFLIIKLNILMKEEILLLPLEKRNDINQKYLTSNNNTEIETSLENEEDIQEEVEDLSSNYTKLKSKYNEIIKNHDKEINQFNIEIQELKEQNNDLKQKITILLEQVNQLNNLITKNNNNYKYPLSSMQNLIERIEILEELKEESTKSSKKASDGINMQLNNILIQEKLNNKKLKKCFKSSSILTKDTDFNFLLNKLSKFNPTSYKIIYKSSIDGDNIKNFHSNCDGEENIIIIIETVKGLKFGGFTSVGFDSSGYELRDDNAFLFSIDRQKIYDIIPGNNAIYCNRKFGPIFCAEPDSSAYSIFIPDNYLKTKSTTTKVCYCYKMEENFELNNGKKEFFVKEMEVFRVDND
jgi:hypothetical protein